MTTEMFIIIMVLLLLNIFVSVAIAIIMVNYCHITAFTHIYDNHNRSMAGNTKTESESVKTTVFNPSREHTETSTVSTNDPPSTISEQQTIAATLSKSSIPTGGFGSIKK